MKKMILLVAVMAMCIACGDRNGAELPKQQDKKALSAVASEAIDMVGEDSVKVGKALRSAGLKFLATQEELEESKSPLLQHCRKMKKAGDPNITEVYYGYNIPTEYLFISDDEEAYQYVETTFREGRSFMIVQVYFYKDKMVGISTTVESGLTKTVNLLYTEESDKMYASISKDAANFTWKGDTGLDAKIIKEYTDHAEFSADIAAADAVEADESASYTTEAFPNGLKYEAFWVHHSEEQMAKETPKGMAYSVWGSFVVYDARYEDAL